MSIDLMLGKTSRGWGRGTSAGSSLGDLFDDPLVWTPSAVRAELARVRGVLDLVNLEASRARSEKKINEDEWKLWRQTYLDGHKLVTTSSPLWGSNVKAARQHEREAQKWRSLLRSRGTRAMGPARAGRPPSPGGVSTLAALAPVLAGGLAAGLVVHQVHRWYHGKKT